MTQTTMIKQIRVDLAKCIGCRACEVACSAYHARPKYSSINPERSRIRVVLDLVKGEYVPIRARGYVRSECGGRSTYAIKGKKYSECSFCGASCQARDLFREPDSGLPLKCDMCTEDPTLSEPLCVQVCGVGALIYSERVGRVKKGPKQDVIACDLTTLARKYGMDKVCTSVAQLSKE